MYSENIIKQAALAAADATVKKLNIGQDKRCKPVNDESFKKTEALLYNYDSYKAAIRDKRALIDHIRENGPNRKGGSIVVLASDGGESISEYEHMERQIDSLKKSICITEYYVKMLELALKSVENDVYYDIIRLKYFEKVNSFEIAERLHIDSSTAWRNGRRLVDKIRIRVFSDEAIMGLMLG